MKKVCFLSCNTGVPFGNGFSVNVLACQIAVEWSRSNTRQRPSSLTQNILVKLLDDNGCEALDEEVVTAQTRHITFSYQGD